MAALAGSAIGLGVAALGGLAGGALVSGGIKHSREEAGNARLIPLAVAGAAAVGVGALALSIGGAGGLAVAGAAALGAVVLGDHGRDAIHGVHMLLERMRGNNTAHHQAGPSQQHGQPGAGSHGDGGHQVTPIPRTHPDDRARAQAIFDANLAMFGDIRRDQLQPNLRGGHHLRLTPELAARFEAAFPGVPTPRSIMFDKKTNRPVAAVYAKKAAPPNLGLGPSHQHGEGKPYMQHVWFAPGDLDLAFSDTAGRREAMQRANARS